MKFEGREIWRAEHCVTNWSTAGDGYCQRDAGVWFGECGAIGFGGVVLLAMRDDVVAGQHPGEGFEEGGGADESECGSVIDCGQSESNGLDGGLFGGDDPLGFSDITGHNDFRIPIEVRW